MKSGPYAQHAAEYFEAGHVVLPMEYDEKRPAKEITKWASYGGGKPKAETRAEWMARYPDRGVVLLTGTECVPGKMIGAIDVDNDAYVAVCRQVVGECPSAKRGKKGVTFFVSVSKNEDLKSTQLRDHEKSRGIVDVLINGKCTVLPPSVHPDTKRPYEWVGLPLLECDFAQLPQFTAHKLLLLRKIIASPHTQAIIGGTATHDAGVPFVGMLVALQCADSEIAAIFASLLPAGYEGNSLLELPEWIASARSKNFDVQGSNQRRTKKELLQIFLESGAALFQDQLSRGFISVSLGSGGVCNMLLESDRGRQ